MRQILTTLFILMGWAMAFAETKEKDTLPIKPINRLDLSCIVVDTLPTGDDRLSVLLFNNNTWRYISNESFKADTTVFAKHWDENNLFPYFNVPLTAIPETVPIQLVDSLRAYHYPYKGYMSSKYGPRNGRSHQGVDLPLKTGDPVYAAFDGKVRITAYQRRGYGHYVVIRHHNGIETLYAHLQKKLVDANENVKAGDPIGIGGNTGRSSGPHLHFEVIENGVQVDPLRFLR